MGFHSERKRWWERHWITPLTFVPFLLMMYVHRRMGLSDAMMIRPRPGTRLWPLYNIEMILAFWAGVGGYMLLTILNFKAGVRYLVIKGVVLAALWIGIVVYMIRSDR